MPALTIWKAPGPLKVHIPRWLAMLVHLVPLTRELLAPNAFFLGNNQLEKPKQRRRTRWRSTHTPRTEKQERKQANTVFNEVPKFAYVLEAGEREILLIQQLITRKYLRDARGIQFMRVLTYIYNQRVIGI